MAQRKLPMDIHDQEEPTYTAHRFPQPGQMVPPQSWEPQERWNAAAPGPQAPMCRDCPYIQQAMKQKRRRGFSFLRGAFTLIGVVTVLVELARYVMIPLLVKLYQLTGGAL